MLCQCFLYTLLYGGMDLLACTRLDLSSMLSELLPSAGAC
jgi:hypothetical protein